MPRLLFSETATQRQTDAGEAKGLRSRAPLMHSYVTVASVASLTAVLPPEARHEHRTYIAHPRESMALSQHEKTASDDL